jgi:hypothetical protein
MKYSSFAAHVKDNTSNFSREFLEERNVSMTIGTVQIASAGLHVAVLRVKGITPYGAERALRTSWHIVTAEDGPDGIVSSDIHKNDVTINVNEAPQLTTLQIGRNALLPDDALLSISPDRQFYPTILMPNAVNAATEGLLYDDRYQVVIPPGGPAEI